MHDYDTDYAVIAEHFNQLNTLRPAVLASASRLMAVCAADLQVLAATDDFTAEFQVVLSETGVAA
ncbi:hypothetical protein ENE75_01875 [Rubrivivax albus]|uniref:Uncharacterized protein n=1 Tax=Rubrivivax albus TaxID=2499835 RepID=A0A3S2U4V4_9BURK|nr:hypothetical protein ENE75_01875 [Rubrivivax albus]